MLVNRIWYHDFGAGIVDTLGDFGTKGAPPTHPELLDWLAGEFIARGWSIKALQRLIVTSATFRQSSRPHSAGLAADADSRLLWRFAPRRLEAEAIRDCTLAAAGTLDLEMGGPGFEVHRKIAQFGEWVPKETTGPETWRRMIYMLRPRAADDGMFAAFDVPDCGLVKAKRSVSTTPIQALNLFNGRFTIEQADHLAKRVAREAGASPADQSRRLFLLTLGREPEAIEKATAIAAIEQADLDALCRAVLNSNEFLFIP